MTIRQEWDAIQAERVACGRHCFTEKGAALRVAWLNTAYPSKRRPAVAQPCGSHWKVNPW